MGTPKHKIFFGAPKPLNLAGKPGGPAKVPCFTWDSTKFVFSSETLTFDCDYDINTLANKELSTIGFRWSMDDITFDSNAQMYN